MFEDALRRLEELRKRAAELDGEHELGFDELFPDEFMLLHTDFPSIQALVEGSPFKVESQADFAAIPDDEWDAFIENVTRFESWKEMQAAASQEWLKRKLRLDE